MRRLIGALGAALGATLGLAGAVPAGAQELPELELGVGAALLARPVYRGSAHSSTTGFPVPYVVYRGKRVQFSRDGLVARLFSSGRLQVRLSASASLPGADSADSRRSGMPELLPTFEAGPSLNLHLGEAGGSWHLRLPVRAAAAADFDEFKAIGWLAYPHLHHENLWRLGDWEMDTTVGAGPLWASREYHRYFYEVAPQFATLERPAYDPGSGYSGARTAFYTGLRHGAWRVAFGITHDTLSGAVMRDSPLVEKGQATVVALGVFYSLWAREP